MSLSDLLSGRTSAEVAWERKQAEETLLRAEHEQHEALLGALRAFGADLPTGDELFKRWGIDRKAKKQR
jgi:hypothetical protein